MKLKFDKSGKYLTEFNKILESKGNASDNMEMISKKCEELGVTEEFNHRFISEYIVVDLSNDIDIFKRCGDYILMTAPCPIKSTHNGYVAVPEDHPLFGIYYQSVDNIDVHGDLTFSRAFKIDNKNYWVFGFDTNHIYSGNWSKKDAEKETTRLYKQLKKMESV
ncbi:MAG: hypothetical protein K9L31_02130 [Candidatus Pacebacteria bacterium]|nr:hypothetical protein [Candidatus Paceibacterota bacterium]MCF7917325.1 hypothetical protein [Candidatus Omnitrophota bacterium]